MATKSSASELTRLINQLRQERQHHLDSMAEIDQTFKEFGISAGAMGGRKVAAAPKPARKLKRGGRGSAAAVVESAAATRKGKGAAKKKVAKKAKAAGARREAAASGKSTGASAGGAKPKSPWGSKFPMTGDELILNFIKDKGGASTEEIRKHWQTSGRKGKAENNLTNLVKSGKIKRNKLEGKPGSNYTIP